MKLFVTDNNGVLLDSVTLTRAEYLAEIKYAPPGLLSQLQLGDEAE